MNSNELLVLLLFIACLIGAAIVFVLFIVIVSNTKSFNNQHSIPPVQRQDILRQPAFRVISIQRTYTNSNIPTIIETPIEWGQLVQRPASIIIYHNQQKCLICTESIDYTYANKGWARCPTTKKIIHGHCYDAWVEIKGASCPICHPNNHNMTRIKYPTQ